MLPRCGRIYKRIETFRERFEAGARYACVESTKELKLEYQYGYSKYGGVESTKELKPTLSSPILTRRIIVESTKELKPEKRNTNIMKKEKSRIYKRIETIQN